MFNTHIL